MIFRKLAAPICFFVFVSFASNATCEKLRRLEELTDIRELRQLKYFFAPEQPFILVVFRKKGRRSSRELVFYRGWLRRTVKPFSISMSYTPNLFLSQVKRAQYI